MAAMAAGGTGALRRVAPERLTGRARYAVKAATGVRLTHIPATPQRVLTDEDTERVACRLHRVLADLPTPARPNPLATAGRGLPMAINSRGRT